MINIVSNKNKLIIIGVFVFVLLIISTTYYLLLKKPSQVELKNDQIENRPNSQSAKTEPDSNNDGLPDSQAKALGLNPMRNDTDDDGIFDVDEINLTFTDPTKADTDGDGYGDLQELRSGNNPNRK